MQENLIIIGSGPAGLTAAIYASRAGLDPLVIEGSNPGGQLMNTSFVENWPGEIRILGSKLMENMRNHALHFNTRFLEETISEVKFNAKSNLLITNTSKRIKTKSLIIASGATHRRLNCPGEKEYWGKGVTTCAVCDGAFYKNRPVVIVGGGDTAMEDASFMTNFTDQITIIHILDQLTASKAMQDRVINNPKIKIIYQSTVTQIIGDGQHVTSVEITHQETGKKTELKTDVVFVAIGLSPNTSIFKDQLKLEKSGHIAVNNFTKTSIEGVFAAGDVIDPCYRQAITSAGFGCMAALDAEKYLKKIGI
jgi:thioredoxin reductase (NADPH)